MNIAIITGASSGLGNEYAKQLGDYFLNIDQIWLIARRKEKLVDLSKQLQENSEVLVIDVTDTFDLELLSIKLAEEKPVIRVLINCAGIGVIGKIENLTLQDQIDMIELNCISLTKITHMCLPYMKEKSRIIQIASSAAFLPQPTFAVYAATKSYVLSFSRALGEEFRKKNIYVTCVCPGPVATEFFEIAERYHEKMKIKDFTISKASHVVRHSLKASVQKKPIAVYGVFMNIFQILAKILPHNMILKIMRGLR